MMDVPTETQSERSTPSIIHTISRAGSSNERNGSAAQDNNSKVTGVTADRKTPRSARTNLPKTPPTSVINSGPTVPHKSAGSLLTNPSHAQLISSGRFLPYIHPPASYDPRKPTKRITSAILEDRQTWTRVSMETSERKRIFFVEDSDDEIDADFRSTPQTVPSHFWRYKLTGNKALDRFRRVVDFILITNKLFSISHVETFTKEESILFFLDVPSVMVNRSSMSPAPEASPQLFDISPYKAIKEQSMEAAVREVLGVPSGSRTEEQIAVAVHSLEVYSTFSAYPKAVQRGICQHGWFSRYEASKVICRQGQRAEVFYLVLSGLAVSRSFDASSETRSDHSHQRAVFLKKGDTFGESELLEDAPRTSTVITKQPLQVLGVDKQDFQKIFQEVMDQNTECLSFLRTVDELSDFPLDVLQVHQFACSSHYYRKGAVVVSNSNESEWIYVIKSGSCQVYKAIKSKPKDRRRKHYKSQPPDGADISSDATSSSMLPPICRPSKGVSKPPLKESHDSRRQSTEELQLPKITQGDERRIVGRTSSMSDSGYGSTQSDDEMLNHKKRQRQSWRVTKCPSEPDKFLLSSPTAFARLEVLLDRGIFGLQSLLYEDTPSLSLVSNGAECVLISKQFLSDRLDNAVLSRLRIKIPPYPSLVNIKGALDEQKQWDSYKQRVVRETLQ